MDGELIVKTGGSGRCCGLAGSRTTEKLAVGMLIGDDEGFLLFKLMVTFGESAVFRYSVTGLVIGLDWAIFGNVNVKLPFECGKFTIDGVKGAGIKLEELPIEWVLGVLFPLTLVGAIGINGSSELYFGVALSISLLISWYMF
jgi:hypothetical protein